MSERFIGLKKVAVFGATFGAGAVLTTALVVGMVHWYQSRPEPWHTNTIVGLSATAAQTFNYNPKLREMKPLGFTFSFIVENKSGHDYTVPQDLKLLKRDKKSQALVEFPAKLDHSYIVLAKDRAEIPVGVEYSCSTFDLDTNRESVRDVRTCFDDAIADVDGFVALDYSSKIRIELPKPVLATGQAGNEEKKATIRERNLLAPDKGDLLDRVAACREADRLITECNAKNLGADKPWVKYGGFSKPLPSLPTPPQGYKLDASESVCKVAIEWQNFCRTHK
ncbi:MAG: hypothetical protein WB994_13795 [Candidatus Acidiferrum sp.]